MRGTRWRVRARARGRSVPQGSRGARGASAPGEDDGDAHDLVNVPVARAACEDLGEADDIGWRVGVRRGDAEGAARGRAGGGRGDATGEDTGRGVGHLPDEIRLEDGRVAADRERALHAGMRERLA